MPVERVASMLVGTDARDHFADMGKAWSFLLSDSQLRWYVGEKIESLFLSSFELTRVVERLGPEKGVIHLATAAVVNALWDLFARRERKPLWRLIVDMTPEELVKVVSFRYISDAITPQEALDLLKKREAGKQDRIRTALEGGYPSYVTSAGWFGYSCVQLHFGSYILGFCLADIWEDRPSDEKVQRLTKSVYKFPPLLVTILYSQRSDQGGHRTGFQPFQDQDWRQSRVGQTSTRAGTLHHR
jgi:hypothetical protein